MDSWLRQRREDLRLVTGNATTKNSMKILLLFIRQQQTAQCYNDPKHSKVNDYQTQTLTLSSSAHRVQQRLCGRS